jgi:hypothetical protein
MSTAVCLKNGRPHSLGLLKGNGYRMAVNPLI